MEERIIAAFADGAKSAEIATPVPEVEAAAAAASAAAAAARSIALDPLLGRSEAMVACEREIRRWNPLGGRTHGYVRPVLSADLPPTLAGLFADARVMDSFIGMAMSPPLPSSPSPKLRAV